MEIPNEELDEWAQTLHDLNSPLLHAMTAGRRGDAQTAGQWAGHVQSKLNRLGHRLVRAGAVDPMAIAQQKLWESAQAAGINIPPPQETPVHLLSSPAARRYAEAIRAAAVACAEMEKERGILDGMTEILEDYAEGAEWEVFGPKALRE